MIKYKIIRFSPNTTVEMIQKTFDALTDEGWVMNEVHQTKVFDEYDCCYIDWDTYTFYQESIMNEVQ